MFAYIVTIIYRQNIYVYLKFSYTHHKLFQENIINNLSMKFCIWCLQNCFFIFTYAKYIIPIRLRNWHTCLKLQKVYFPYISMKSLVDLSKVYKKSKSNAQKIFFVYTDSILVICKRIQNLLLLYIHIQLCRCYKRRSMKKSYFLGIKLLTLFTFVNI